MKRLDESLKFETLRKSITGKSSKEINVNKIEVNKYGTIQLNKQELQIMEMIDEKICNTNRI